MKLLVETTGPFQLTTDDHTLIRHGGYTLIAKSPFVYSRTVLGQVRTLAEVSDEASDAEWLRYVTASDGDLDLALAAFVSAFPLDGKKPEPAPAKKAKG